MSLKYRGASYETATSQVSVAQETIGRYRGAVVARKVVQNVASHSVPGLVYRGAVVR